MGDTLDWEGEVGNKLGSNEGDWDGTILGFILGEDDGDHDGTSVGVALGIILAPDDVGFDVTGTLLGDTVG